MPARGHSYLRFSCLEQRHGDSIRRQTEWTNRRAAELGVTLDDARAFSDHGISGYRGKNAEVGELARFLDLCERSIITPGSYLFVESLDRLSRDDVFDAWEVFRKIIQAGIIIVTREPDRLYSREQIAGNWLSLLEPLFIFARANNESSTKAMRAREQWMGRREAAKEGVPMGTGNTPAWIEETEEGYRLIEPVVAIIRRIFADCTGGMSYREIASALNSEGVPCPGRSGRWGQSYVRIIITGRKVLGDFQPCRRDERGLHIPVGEPIPGFYPAAVDEETWLRAQLAIRQRRGKRGRPAGSPDRINLFVGMVRDAQTGRKLSCVGGSQGQSYLGDAMTNAGMLNYPRFEACILDTLAMLRPEDVLDCCSEQTERETRIAELNGQLIALAHRVEQLQNAAADLSEDAEAILPILLQVRQERKRVATELERLKLDGVTGRAEVLVEAQSLAVLYRKATGTEREALARRIKAALPSVVEGIWVYAQRVNAKRHIHHIQIYLVSGGKRCVQMLPKDCHGVEPWQLDECDFRSGDVGDTAPMAVPAQA